MYSPNTLDKYSSFCKSRLAENKYRVLSSQFQNENLLDFSSNDYLLLGSKKNIAAIEFACEISKKYGVGSTGSRLLSGNNEFITDFEEQISVDKNTEKALIFNSGYQANISVISSLCDSKIIGVQAEVFFDKSNHSSLYQGVFLSKSELIRYNHNDLESLERLLDEKKHTGKPKFIISETVFGMDGDTANIPRLIELAKKYNALLYLDEAHSTGLYGKSGYGLSSDFINLYQNLVIMGTFSKAIGSSGAYIASNEIIINYLINNCHGFIYSTAPSPLSIAIARFNWNKISTKEVTLARSELVFKSDYLRKKLIEYELKFYDSNTNIMLLKCKTSEESLQIKEKLLSKNILVSAIRPPTAPSPRVRIALNSGHTIKQIDYLVESLILN